MRLPVLERTELFSRSIGELTDIVEKEMYTFDDRNGESVTLRPEATAGVVRAGLSNGLLHNQQQKLWCSGPMFRREKPQKGRYRQFHQLSVEALGFAEPEIDAELIALSARLWRSSAHERDARAELDRHAGVAPGLQAETGRALLGASRAARRGQPAAARPQPAAHPRQQESGAEGADRRPRRCCRGISTTNRARISIACSSCFADVGVEFTLNPRLVRGLDYYSRTVFEWLTDRLGSQSAMCSGGRYDGLVAQLGGRDTPAVGWALGIERIVEVLEVEGARR